MDKLNFAGPAAHLPSDAPRAPLPVIGQLLIAAGRLSPDAAGRVAAQQKQSGLPFGETAVALGLVSNDDVRAALARQFDYPVLSPGDDGVAPELVAAFAPQSPRVEALRQLRSQLVLQRLANPARRTVAIVGLDRGEGRSWLAANLAVAFSQLGEHTLLVDADLRHPRQHELFRVGTGNGLAARLAERSAGPGIAAHPRLARLAVLPAGNLPPNPQELLARPAFATELALAREHFEMVIVDTPADQVGADARLVAAACGSAVIVARRHHTASKALGHFANSLREAGVTVAGGVLLDF